VLARAWELPGVVEEAPSSPACDPATRTVPVLSSVDLSEKYSRSRRACPHTAFSPITSDASRSARSSLFTGPPRASSSPADRRTFLHSFVEDGWLDFLLGMSPKCEIWIAFSSPAERSPRSCKLLTDSLRPPPPPHAILFPSAPSMKFVLGFPLTLPRAPFSLWRAPRLRGVAPMHLLRLRLLAPCVSRICRLAEFSKRGGRVAHPEYGGFEAGWFSCAETLGLRCSSSPVCARRIHVLHMGRVRTTPSSDWHNIDLASGRGGGGVVVGHSAVILCFPFPSSSSPVPPALLG
jgi:hypothetical protein